MAKNCIAALDNSTASVSYGGKPRDGCVAESGAADLG